VSALDVKSRLSQPPSVEQARSPGLPLLPRRQSARRSSA